MFHYIILNSPVMWLMLSLTNKSVNIHSMSCFHTHNTMVVDGNKVYVSGEWSRNVRAWSHLLVCTMPLRARGLVLSS